MFQSPASFYGRALLYHWGQKMKKIYFSIFMGLLFFMMLQASTLDEQNDFTYGEKLFSEGFYDAAVLQFKDYAEQYTESPYLPSAYFYIGESLFYQEKYQSAIDAYLQFLYKFPESKQVEQAQLRLAECYEKVNQFDKAISAYTRIFEFFPKSESSKSALLKAGKLAFRSGKLIQAESIVRTLQNQTLTTDLRLDASVLMIDILTALQKYEEATQSVVSLLSMDLKNEQKVFLLKKEALIYEKTGQWQHAFIVLQKAFALIGDDVSKCKIAYEIGNLSQILGNVEEAEKNFKIAMQIPADSLLFFQSSIALGHLNSKNKKYDAAIQLFLQAQSYAPSPLEKINCRYNVAKSKLLMGNATESLNDFTKIRFISLQDTFLLKGILLDYSLACEVSGFDQQAIQEYLNYYHQFPDDPLSAFILSKIAVISKDKLKLWNQAEYYLREAQAQYPSHPFAPQIQYQYAELLMQKGRWQEALLEYQKLNQNFPGNGFMDSANQKANILTVIQKVCEALLEMDASESVIFSLKLGYFTLIYQSNPDEAIPYFEKVLDQLSLQEQRDDVQWCLVHIYQLQELLNPSDLQIEKIAHLFQVTEASSSVPERQLAADFWLLKKNPSEDAYKTMLAIYADPKAQSEIYTHLGVLKFAQNKTEEAFPYFQMALKLKDSGYDCEPAYWGLAKNYLAMNQLSAADSIYQYYLQDYPNGRYQAVFLFDLGKALQASSKLNKAETCYEQLVRKFAYTPYADSARYQLTQLYLDQQKWQDAAMHIKELLVQDSIQTVAFQHGLIDSHHSQRAQYLYRLGEIYQTMQQYEKANTAYLEFGRAESSELAYRLMISKLAELAEAQNQHQRAVEYLEVLTTQDPDETLLAQLGTLQFQLRQYEDAIVTFDKAIAQSQAIDAQAKYSAKTVVSLLKLGKIPQANVRINVFQNTFKNLPNLKYYLCQFSLEKGNAQLNQKNFQLAEEAFEDARKMKVETWMPEAELGIGKVLLITNKTEKALEKLTDMIHDYPDDMVLAKVYLNLGDYYFRNQHYENALQAFHKILDLYPDPEIVPLAIRYLIRVYENLRFWDAAIGLARRYVNDYPDAEDVMTKKVQIGTYLMNMKEYQRAVDHLSQLQPYADAESEAEIQYWIGKAYSEMGLFERAILEFLKVKYLSKPTKLPWASTALYEAGSLYARINKPEEAIQLFNKIVKIEGAASDLGRIAKGKIDELKQTMETTK